MTLCIKCNSIQDEDAQVYFISDMCEEMLSVIVRFTSQAGDNDDAILCEQCFEEVLHEFQNIPTEGQHVCVWCRNSLFRRRSHYIPEGVIRDEISARIYPRLVHSNSLVCYACWVYVRQLVEDTEDNQHTATTPQNTNICAWCTVSLNNRRSHSLSEGREREIIIERISPRQIPTDARVCYACWVRAQRSIRRQTHPQQEPRPGPSYVQSSQCVWCRSSLFHRQYHVLNEGPERDAVLQRISPQQIPSRALICMSCWRQIQESQYNNPEDIEPNNATATIELDQFKHTTHSSHCCFVPDCGNAERLHVPNYLRKRILKSQKLYVTNNSRICQEHIVTYNWDFLSQFEFNNNFNKRELEAMLLLLLEEEITSFDLTNIDLISENIFRFWTGLTKEQFNNLLSQLPTLNNTCKSPKKALGLFLIKSHTGESYERIASLFLIDKSSVCRLLKYAREALKNDFVPLHLGCNHLGRDELIQKNLIIPEGIFGDREQRRPIVICDGTYVYLQKSSNYLFQKKTYSLHKYRNLVKPFLIVATDGHILDVFGPYPATTSDADIMKTLFQDENGELRSYFRPNDIFILDRGFRDSIPFLESLGYKVNKPASLNEGETQLSTINANKSRLITLCRWVVEVVNGIFKNEYKLFRAEYFNTASTHLMDDFRICAALINAYHVRLRDRPDAELILNRALTRLHIPNYLSQYVVTNNINRRRAQFVRIDSENEALDIFPHMTMSDLILFALGIYQIKQARSYYGEHIRRNGSFEVEISNALEPVPETELSSSEGTVLLRGRIKSRYQSNKIYYTYILISPEGNSWEEKLSGYYCSCICGNRTVGCCAHVMTIVWFLGWARHQDDIRAPASFLDGILVRDDVENE